MNHVREYFGYIDTYLSRTRLETAKLGKPVSCKAGCFHCCREMVYAEKEEVRYLVSQIKPEDLAQITEKAAQWWAQFFNGIHNMVPNTTSTDYDAKQGLWAYRAANIWCPLLKDGLCSQYENRPASCRMHYAVGSWRRCEDDEKRKKQLFVNADQDGAMMVGALHILCQNAYTAVFSYDHLGVWLGHFLLGKTERSAGAIDQIVNQTDPL